MSRSVGIFEIFVLKSLGPKVKPLDIEMEASNPKSLQKDSRTESSVGGNVSIVRGSVVPNETASMYSIIGSVVHENCNTEKTEEVRPKVDLD